jgi:hypothetical protein
MKTTIKNAAKLALQIEKKYNELNTDNSGFFDLYHDDLKTQSDCAYQDFNDLEEYLKTPKKVYNNTTSKELADDIMENLKATLIYVSFIIDIQNQLNNTPKSVYC